MPYINAKTAQGIVKAISKHLGKDPVARALRAVKRKQIFVENIEALMRNRYERWLFAVSTGGHGKVRWVAQQGMDYVTTIAQSAAGANAAGLAQLGDGITAFAGKTTSAGRQAMVEAFKSGVKRDAHEISRMAGARNFMHVLKAQKLLACAGVIDVWMSNNPLDTDPKVGFWACVPSDDSSYGGFFLNNVLTKGFVGRAKATNVHGVGYQFRGRIVNAIHRGPGRLDLRLEEGIGVPPHGTIDLELKTT